MSQSSGEIVDDRAVLFQRNDELSEFADLLSELAVPVEVSADGLLDPLRALLGEAGTVLIPLGAEPGGPFDAHETPAEREIGVLAEVFRRRP